MKLYEKAGLDFSIIKDNYRKFSNINKLRDFLKNNYDLEVSSFTIKRWLIEKGVEKLNVKKLKDKGITIEYLKNLYARFHSIKRVCAFLRQKYNIAVGKDRLSLYLKINGIKLKWGGKRRGLSFDEYEVIMKLLKEGRCKLMKRTMFSGNKKISYYKICCEDFPCINSFSAYTYLRNKKSKESYIFSFKYLTKLKETENEG